MDFFRILEREGGTQKKPVLEIYPDFRVKSSKDLMIRSKAFYAVWDEAVGLWSTNEFDVQRLVDEALMAYQTTTTGFYEESRKLMANFSTKSWTQFRMYLANMPDNSRQLDETLTFRNTVVTKEDFVSRRLSYDLVDGDISAWDELVSTLYAPSERAKIEWAIGAIIAGDSKTIHKFLVFYGAPGTGKSTILNIIQMLFEEYVATFVAADLTSGNSAFAMESFKSNPLVAIEHDGDLSKIKDTSRLNSIVAHEPMQFNEKFKSPYMSKVLAMLMIGSNSPVKITDAKSGLIRRLIDVVPTGKLIPARKYQTLMNQIHFELGAIAKHCLDVYRSMGKDFYSGYKPVEMMLQTDVFFNFIEAHYDQFERQDGVTLDQAFNLYKEFIKESEIEYSLPRYKMREELRNYFDHFDERGFTKDGDRVRSWYSGFKADKFKSPVGKKEERMFSLVMDETTSLLDERYKDCPAQYSNSFGSPIAPWDEVTTTLKDLDTTKEHFVQVPENEIVIDFDLRDADGNKSLERCLEKASLWPATYAEYSRSGDGIHLHYAYDGAVEELSSSYDDGIEVKVYSGKSSLRRRVTRANNVPMATISSGLPLKEKKVLNEDSVKNEMHLRSLIKKALRKEVHPGTKSNVDFIKQVLDDAFASGIPYDVSDMRQTITNFAAKSTNQSNAALGVVQKMEFKSTEVVEPGPEGAPEDKLVFFDCEVFPNLFIICWKYEDSDQVQTMINPTAAQVAQLFKMKLVGYNVRKYDNHILYGASLGLSCGAIYSLSKRIIDNQPNAYYAQAYGLSYVDIYDYAALKKSLKWWQIMLGIAHMELGLDWDKPVPEELWEKVAEYCRNDVISTEAVHKHLKGDFIARQILADLSGLPVNNTTQQHAAAIVFEGNRNPQDAFIYTDLSEEFPGYEFRWSEEILENGIKKVHRESVFEGEVTGEGGYVYAEPGYYENVALLDIQSMHPTTIEQLNLFGDYTKNYSTIKKTRVLIKQGELELAKQMFGGRLAKFLEDEDLAEALSYALKIVVNIVYGLTSASFPNAFRDPRNIDNIVAKRGALFMILLKKYVQSLGFTVAHIKTDSIKIPNATKDIIESVMEFGERYGYIFEHEANYEKMVLINDAVYVAYAAAGRKPAHWETVGKQFQVPYVKKRLFTNEEIEFKDMTEQRAVQTVMYLDYTGVTPDEYIMDPKFMGLTDKSNAELHPEKYQRMQFIGKTGLFCPMEDGAGGGQLLREKDGKFYAVQGTKGYSWLESEVVQKVNKEAFIDVSYFEKQVADAIEALAKFTDVSALLSTNKKAPVVAVEDESDREGALEETLRLAA